MFCTECGTEIGDAEVCPVCHPPAPAPTPVIAPPPAADAVTAPRPIDEMSETLVSEPVSVPVPEYVPPAVGANDSRVAEAALVPPSGTADPLGAEPTNVREPVASEQIEIGPSPATSAMFGGSESYSDVPPLGIKLKEAGLDTAKAFGTFVINPVGGLAAVYERLGQSRALVVGIVFAVVAQLFAYLGVYVGSDSYARPDIVDTIKFLFFGALPFLCLLGGNAAARKLLGKDGGVGGDAFNAGATLLPLGLTIFVIGLFGLVNFNVIAVLVLFTLCVVILTLYTGVTRIALVAESRAAFAVPIMIVIAFVITKIIFDLAMPNMLPSLGKIFG